MQKNQSARMPENIKMWYNGDIKWYEWMNEWTIQNEVLLKKLIVTLITPLSWREEFILLSAKIDFAFFKYEVI